MKLTPKRRLEILREFLSFPQGTARDREVMKIRTSRVSSAEFG